MSFKTVMGILPVDMKKKNVGPASDTVTHVTNCMSLKSREILAQIIIKNSNGNKATIRNPPCESTGST